MGTHYSHLSDSERWEIEFRHKDGWSLAAIGRKLGRDRSTIMREVRRGFDARFDRYLAVFGQQYYGLKRRQAGRCRRKLDAEMQNPAWKTVLFGLRQDWSPQQLCDRLNDGALPPYAVAAGLSTLSHQTIYRAIYDMPRGLAHAELLRMLRQSRAGRRKPRKPKSERFTGIGNMTPISQRPHAANARLEPGHWEGDLLKGAGGRSMVATLVDRFTRMTLLVKLSSGCADEVHRAILSRLRTLPAHMRRSLTYDRGTEMARHEQFTARSGMPVFFCDAYCPWQRGTNENTNGLLRQYLPKGSDLSLASRVKLSWIERRLNGRPRRVLARQTPQEVYDWAKTAFAPFGPEAARS
jgi:transposase, IS30 family